MSLVLLFNYLLFNMFRMLVHPCDNPYAQHQNILRKHYQNTLHTRELKNHRKLQQPTFTETRLLKQNNHTRHD
jgi:hypothetical protein